MIIRARRSKGTALTASYSFVAVRPSVRPPSRPAPLSTTVCCVSVQWRRQCPAGPSNRLHAAVARAAGTATPGGAATPPRRRRTVRGRLPFYATPAGPPDPRLLPCLSALPTAPRPGGVLSALSAFSLRPAVPCSRCSEQQRRPDRRKGRQGSSAAAARSISACCLRQHETQPTRRPAQPADAAPSTRAARGSMAAVDRKGRRFGCRCVCESSASVVQAVARVRGDAAAGADSPRAMKSRRRQTRTPLSRCVKGVAYRPGKQASTTNCVLACLS